MLSLLIWVPAFIFSFCSSPDKAPKLFGINRDNVGVVVGNTMKVYGRQSYQQWEHVPHNTFTPPPDTKDYFIAGEKIGVYHTDGKVDFFRNRAPGKWEMIPDNQYFKVSFQGPANCDRVYCEGESVTEFIKGRTMRIYQFGNAHPEFDFTAPESATDVFPCGEGLLVCSKTGIDLYKLNLEKKQWELQPVSHLNYPAGKIGVLPICGDYCVGIIKEKQLDIYFMFNDKAPEFYDSFSYPK